MEKTSANNVSDNASQIPFQGVKMIVSALICCCGCLLYMPVADLFRTIPFIAVFSVVADAVYKKLRYTLSVNFVFSFLMHCVYGLGMTYAVFYSLCGVGFAALAIYGIRLIAASFKTEREHIRLRCRLRAAWVLVLCFAAYALLCGNIFSFVSAKSENLEYINKNYKDTVKVNYTDFDAASREYKTYISFYHDGALIGDAAKCYISKNHDGRRDYLEELLLEELEVQLNRCLSTAVDMSEITNSGLYFEKGEIIPTEAQPSAYGNKAWYVVSLYHVTESKEDFAKLCTDCLLSLKNSADFEFSEIIICGGNTNEVLYTVTVTEETLKVDAVYLQDVSDFDSGYMKKYGVTEKNYLDYWQNR